MKAMEVFIAVVIGSLLACCVRLYDDAGKIGTLQAEVKILNEQVNTLSGQVLEIAKIQNDILRQTLEEEVKR